MQEKRSGAHQANQVCLSSQRTEAVRCAQAGNYFDRDSVRTTQKDKCGFQLSLCLDLMWDLLFAP